MRGCSCSFRDPVAVGPTRPSEPDHRMNVSSGRKSNYFSKKLQQGLAPLKLSNYDLVGTYSTRSKTRDKKQSTAFQYLDRLKRERRSILAEQAAKANVSREGVAVKVEKRGECQRSGSPTVLDVRSESPARRVSTLEMGDNGNKGERDALETSNRGNSQPLS